MPALVHPQYPDDLDTSKPLPHANYESFCRAVARAESITDAFRTYIDPGCPVTRARRAGPHLWRKKWVRERVEHIEAELQRIANARAPLVKDDVLLAVSEEFRILRQLQPETLRDREYKVRGLCQLGEMINKLTGAYASKPQKNQINIRARKNDIEEDER